MAQLSAWLQIALDFAGSMLSLAFYSALVAIMLIYQYYEYTRLWPHGRLSWWLIKVATPLSVLAIVWLALSLFGTSGMEGLAVFYLGLFGGLLATPVMIVVSSRLASIPPRHAFLASGTLLMCVYTGWFAVAGAGNSLGDLESDNLESRADYLAYKYAADHAASADGVISLAAQDSVRLPDGSRLAHLAFRVRDGYQIHTIRVRTGNQQGSGRWSSTLGTCVSPGILHITSVLDTSEQFGVQLRFHAGSPETMVEFRGDYSFPSSEESQLEFLTLRLHQGKLSSPVPLPAYWMTVYFSGTRQAKMEQLMPVETGRWLGMAPGRRCFVNEVEVGTGVERVEAILYSEEHYRRSSYLLPLSRR